MESKARDRPDKKDLDLSQKWLRHLREATKTTITLPCPHCQDHKILASEEALLNHIIHVHPEKIPPKEDSEAFDKFKESLRSAAPPSSKPRYALPLFYDGLAFIYKNIVA
jgi:hypothetical protein